MQRRIKGYLSTLLLVGAGISSSCGSEQKFSGNAFSPTDSLKAPAAEDSTARTTTPPQDPQGPQDPQEVGGMQHQSPDGDPKASTPPPQAAEPEKPVDTLALCGTGAMKTRKVKVVFPANVKGCPWGQKDNLSPKDGTARARIEQVADLGVEANQMFCGVSLSSPVQDIKFDDEMILTLNGRVLMSSYDYTDRFDSIDGQAVYAWNQLAGAINPGPATPPKPYCLGSAAADGSMNCAVPKTETSGKFELTIPMAESAKLSAMAKKKGKAELGLIVTGDNDAGDCSHSDLTLDVEITYIGKK